MLTKLRKFFAAPTTYVQRNGPGESNVVSTLTTQTNQFVTTKTLTFAGVAVGAGVITKFFSPDGNSFVTKIVAIVVAFLVGGFITAITITDPADPASKSKHGRNVAIGLGVLNSLLLMIQIYGVATITG
ncbi:hypothetical protein [Rhodococcoides fascians]|uniref:hypothetical protein n=1 Tax=Rhodococcoides fascians TaxID=1828 RepID=UPI0012D367B8|nr:hypothetical protein [Rhodococcus fascians]